MSNIYINTIILGCISAIALLFTLSRAIGWRKMLENAVLVDIGITSLMLFLYMGTFSGMATALIAGLCAAIILYTCQFFYMYKLNIIKKNIYIN